jgi:hypothetical protein
LPPPATQKGATLTTSPATGIQTHPGTRAALIAGCLLAALLVVATLVRCPGNAATLVSYVTLGGIALVVLLHLVLPGLVLGLLLGALGVAGRGLACPALVQRSRRRHGSCRATESVLLLPPVE